MCDGSAGVLFATCATPHTALELVRDAWLGDDNRPVEIHVYAGGKTKAVGQVLVKWGGWR